MKNNKKMDIMISFISFIGIGDFHRRIQEKY